MAHEIKFIIQPTGKPKNPTLDEGLLSKESHPDWFPVRLIKNTIWLCISGSIFRVLEIVCYTRLINELPRPNEHEWYRDNLNLLLIEELFGSAEHYIYRQVSDTTSLTDGSDWILLDKMDVSHSGRQTQRICSHINLSLCSAQISE